MIDPAAMGTLLIGLDGDQAKTQDHRMRRSVAAPRRARGGFRLALAGTLKRAAYLLERPSVGEVAQ